MQLIHCGIAAAFAFSILISLTEAENDKFRIAFASCNRQHRAQIFWPFIASRNPDVFAWLGDIVYADTFPFRRPATLEEMNSSYLFQRNHPEYQKLTSHTPVIGVWDDHDFGNNNGDKHSFGPNYEGLGILWDFLGEPADSPRRVQSGAWSRHVFQSGARSVRIILLDNRSHRDPYVRPRISASDPQDMLGEEQWAWLENELTATRTDVTIIGTGVQVLSNDKITTEGYYQLAGSQAKLLALVAKTNTSHALFISGDVHLAELSRVTSPDLPYPVYDFTSSGLTHASVPFIPSWLLRRTWSGARRIEEIVLERNFGEIDIEWGDQDHEAMLTMRAFGPDFQVKIEHRVSLALLTSDSPAQPHVVECANSNPHHGLSESCSRLLDSLSGQRTVFSFISTLGMYTFIGACVVFTLLTAVIAPFVVTCSRSKARRRTAWSCLGVAGALIALVYC